MTDNELRQAMIDAMSKTAGEVSALRAVVLGIIRAAGANPAIAEAIRGQLASASDEVEAGASNVALYDGFVEIRDLVLEALSLPTRPGG